MPETEKTETIETIETIEDLNSELQEILPKLTSEELGRVVKRFIELFP